ncbi:MAG TPA: hypothetical protein VGM93_01875, partial [Acidimicrobiales bacterium]
MTELTRANGSGLIPAGMFHEFRAYWYSDCNEELLKLNELLPEPLDELPEPELDDPLDPLPELP